MGWAPKRQPLWKIWACFLSGLLICVPWDRFLRQTSTSVSTIRDPEVNITSAYDILSILILYLYTHTHTSLAALFSGTTWVSRYKKGKTSLDITETRDSEWQWHQLGHICKICTSLWTDNHTSTPPLSYLQPGCPSCSPTNSVKSLKAALILELYGT